jgi:ABC-type lipoprotein release transport system permease subunit
MMPVYMNYELFERVIGHRPYFDHVDIILDDSASSDDIKHAGYVLRNHADYYGNMTVNQTDSDFYVGLEENKNYSSVFLYICTILLAVIPIIWIFTQILFYQKRKQEFDVFFAIGADNSEINQIFILEGAIITGLAVLTYVLFGVLAVALLRYVANSEMWQYLVSTERIMRFDFKLPIWQFVLGLVITALGAFLSSYLSLKIYRKNCHSVFTGFEIGDTEQTVIANGDDNN